MKSNKSIKKIIKFKILYLVSSLVRVGPNKQQYYIFKNLNKNIYDPYVLTLFPEGKNSMRKDFVDLGVKVFSLNLVKSKVWNRTCLLYTSPSPRD